MKSSDYGCSALSFCMILAALSGCGRLPSIGAPGRMQPSTPIRPASQYLVLHSFGSGADGQDPAASLLDIKGTLFGVTESGGTYNLGTIFSMTMAGAEKVLYSFCSQNACSDGENPSGSLINVKGTLYGTTTYGGANAGGTIFSITPSGTEKVLHSFGSVNDDGVFPEAPLLDVKGTLYGATGVGGTNSAGTVFSITTTGAEKVLYSFCSQKLCSDGVNPSTLINVKGALYGVTYQGGAHRRGTVFSISTAGKERVLHSFSGGSDGQYPGASLLDVGGILYGTTLFGGAHSRGTVFSISTAGKEHVLYSFAGSPDGESPEASLLDVNGVLYGTTFSGGVNGHKYRDGTIFSMSMTGSERVLFSFGGSSHGKEPSANLINVKGMLYGTTFLGGTYKHGTVFAFSP